MHLMVNDPQIDYSGGVSGNPIDVNTAGKDERSFFDVFIAGRLPLAPEGADFPDTAQNRHYSNQPAYFVDNCCHFGR
jgi:hypothetical protein